MSLAPSLMKEKAHVNHEWARSKTYKGIFTDPQLKRYADDGSIRTSHIRRPGQTRGVRLYNVEDINRLIADGIEGPSRNSDQPGENPES